MHTPTYDLSQRAQLIQSDLVQWRRHIHRYPELSFQERQTSLYIKQVLESIGSLDIETDIAGTGIIATLRAGEGPVIGLRADMDALPIQEENETDYRSQHPGVMHACGHDAHVAILLGAAKLLTEDARAGAFTGTIKFIFQPAEEAGDKEGKTGAVHMLESGRLDDVETAIALHMCPWQRTGDMQIHDGPSMANVDNFSLVIKGSGGHGGYPHMGTDPIWISSYVLQGLYSLMNRKVDPMEVGVLSVGEIHGGLTSNVIPDSVTISGTMRSYTPEVRAQITQELQTMAGMITSLGGTYELDIEHGEPALFNHPKVNTVIRNAASSLYPDSRFIEEAFGMGGEDFGHMTTRMTGAMFFLGCNNSSSDMKRLHTSTFDIDENVLPMGTAILADCATRLLPSKVKLGGEME
ncbi:M20 family metallopeptidase [Thalassobacillus sp. CUG 92003]|uniref:M20 metallopeptidase family protein n=1 Tax=Thalassobacillus sp. CUG 92003 TaxID=2736641 RepID=UPI0015E6996E|nr:amidohydrolase [Thalassobacillus sp. CUG 92003]